jgi:hypothetical protein
LHLAKLTEINASVADVKHSRSYKSYHGRSNSVAMRPPAPGQLTEGR